VLEPPVRGSQQVRPLSLQKGPWGQQRLLYSLHLAARRRVKPRQLQPAHWLQGPLP
jgi:hypothetical protein